MDLTGQYTEYSYAYSDANFDYLTTAEVITKCCEQLGIGTSNNSIYNQSELLLNNLNDHDRQLVADSLDLNESSNTLS